MPRAPGGPRGPTGPFRKEKQSNNILNSSGLHAMMTSCCFREVVLQSVQALRAHQRVQCVPEVPGEREETLFRVWTGRINAQRFRLCIRQCVNLQEVRGVQGDLWNPSCPAEKHKVVSRRKCETGGGSGRDTSRTSSPWVRGRDREPSHHHTEQQSSVWKHTGRQEVSPTSRHHMTCDIITLFFLLR